MSRIEDILVDARDILVDSGKERWSDITLLRLVRGALEDVAKQTDLYRTEAQIKLIKGVPVYQLPTDLILLKAVLFNNKELDIVNTEYLDKVEGFSWRSRTTDTTIECVVRVQQDWDKIRIYPIPYSDSLYTEYTFNQSYGFDYGIEDFSSDSPYGLIGALYDDGVLIDIDAYGVLASISDGYYLTLIYRRQPKLPTTVFDTLDLPRAFDTAIAKYVAGMALRHDLDAQNRKYGDETLTLYARDLTVISNVAVKDLQTAQRFNTQYNGIG